MITEKRNKIFDKNYVIKETECWNWQGYINKSGYGLTSFRKDKNKQSRFTAHRYSYIRFKGEIPERLHVCHTCDNRICVNPKHLWLGTSFDNMRDKGKKGNQCKGDKHGSHKLTDNEVIEILNRLEKGGRGNVIANDYGVSSGLIYHIKNNLIWTHIKNVVDREKLKKTRFHFLINYAIRILKKYVKNIKTDVE